MRSGSFQQTLDNIIFHCYEWDILVLYQIASSFSYIFLEVWTFHTLDNDYIFLCFLYFKKNIEEHLISTVSNSVSWIQSNVSATDMFAVYWQSLFHSLVAMVLIFKNKDLFCQPNGRTVYYTTCQHAALHSVESVPNLIFRLIQTLLHAICMTETNT